MKKTKIELAIGGAELLTAIGVSTLMGGAVALVKPANLGVIKRVACGVGGLAIASMLSDEAVAYVGKTLRSVTDSVKVVFVKKETVYESENSEITE